MNISLHHTQSWFGEIDTILSHGLCPELYFHSIIFTHNAIRLLEWYTKQCSFVNVTWSLAYWQKTRRCLYPDSKVHGAAMEPVRGQKIPRWAPCCYNELCYLGCDLRCKKFTVFSMPMETFSSSKSIGVYDRCPHSWETLRLWIVYIFYIQTKIGLWIDERNST